MLDPKRARLAELYFLSNSFMYGRDFRFSVHIDNPELELSPQKLHFPVGDEPGTEYLPELFGLVAELNVELINAQRLTFDRLCGVPMGALPLGEALAKKLRRKRDLVVFDKIESPGSTEFILYGPFPPGLRLLIVEDHTSGGRNKLLMKAAAEASGLEVADMITIVDRQQGGVGCLAKAGVRLHSLLTLDDLLDYGLERGYLDVNTVTKIRGYIARNQFWTPEMAQV